MIRKNLIWWRTATEKQSKPWSIIVDKTIAAKQIRNWLHLLLKMQKFFFIDEKQTIEK